MTTERAHGVYLAGADIGTLVQRGDATRFVFRDGYWEDPNRQVLGVWFEDNPHASPRASLRLPAWFSNLLPEGRLRDWVARERGVSSERELQILLQIGRDLPGAVEIRPDAGDSSLTHLLSESAQAERQIDEMDIALLKFSLAGIGMKFSMVRDGDRLTLPAGNALGDWIVKLPDSSFPRLVENEYCMMQIARAVGIEVPDIELVHRDQIQSLPGGLWPVGEDRAYAIRRFDRGVGGSRIHIEDFAQVRGWYSQQKYDGSFATVGALSYRGYDRRSLRQFVKRMTLNLLIGNGDAHLKNWSFIYPDGRIPTLSPAYDIVSTAPYYADASPENLGLKFGGTRSFSKVGRSNFDYLQRKLQVSSGDVLDVVDETLERFFEVWDSGSGGELPAEMRAWISGHAVRMRRRLSLGGAA